MDAILPLDQMTTAEKLRAMEALWADLTRQADNFESPAWHEGVLREREQRVAEGKETYGDWEEAKRQLRERHL
ncbi:MAG: addiction module protein [Lacunisphaera sp.]